MKTAENQDVSHWKVGHANSPRYQLRAYKTEAIALAISQLQADATGKRFTVGEFVRRPSGFVASRLLTVSPQGGAL